jgi:tetratricopeptide (TPR) repeat protein
LREEADSYRSWVALGRALIAGNHPAGAERALVRARELRPEETEPRILLGNLLRGLGRYGEAKAQLDDVLTARPGDAGATLGLAELDLAQGKPGRGLERLAPKLDTAASPRGAARLAARLLLADDRHDEAARRIEEWLKTPGLSPLERAGLFSLRGRALDRLGRHEAAWQAWTESHLQRPSRFDGRHFSSAIDRLIGAYDAALFAERAAASRNRDEGPVLIVGTPRSGKSILEQILASHPAIRGAGELRYLGAMTNEVARRAGDRKRPYPDCVGALSDGDLDELAHSYRGAIEEIAEGARWVVDTQPTNFLHIGLAALLQPNIRVVLCRRDPLDAAWACFSTHFADPGLDFVSSPEGIACYLDGMGRLMQHWQKVSPANIQEVRYEHLVAAPREALEPVLEALGLQWDEGMLAYSEPGRPKLDRAPALTQPLNASEIGRGAPYRDRFAEIVRLSADEGHDG